MFTVNVKITEKNPGAYKALKKRLEQISRKRVVAGFPKGKLNNPHYDSGASIIDVAIWNNFGVPEMNIPRRDFMNPASQEWQKYFQQMVEASSQEIANGEIDIDNFLNLMGQAGAEFISEAIVKLRRPPNAQITIDGGWMRNKKSGKPFKVEGKKSTNPLVDSGDLSKAPTYEIRIKNK
jgi:hypothetical protein